MNVRLQRLHDILEQCEKHYYRVETTEAEMLELNEEMRRSRLPVTHSYLVPTFPTEPERKLRLVLNDQRKRT